tara:strand:+ start:109 stop:672 length:564 start_codon:yes stop_codon:yes gene_type:complete
MVKYLGIPTAFATGATDVTGSSQLLDATADFVAGGVQVGDKVFIQGAFGTFATGPATVTSVSTTSLGLSEAIAGTAGETYFIFAGDKDPKRDKYVLSIENCIMVEGSGFGANIIHINNLANADAYQLQTISFGATYTNTEYLVGVFEKYWERAASSKATDSIHYIPLNEFYDSVNNQWYATSQILIA